MAIWYDLYTGKTRSGSQEIYDTNNQQAAGLVAVSVTPAVPTSFQFYIKRDSATGTLRAGYVDSTATTIYSADVDVSTISNSSFELVTFTFTGNTTTSSDRVYVVEGSTGLSGRMEIGTMTSGLNSDWNGTTFNSPSWNNNASWQTMCILNTAASPSPSSGTRLPPSRS